MKRIKVEEGSGNVFKDLGFRNHRQMLAKAERKLARIRKTQETKKK